MATYRMVEGADSLGGNTLVEVTPMETMVAQLVADQPAFLNHQRENIAGGERDPSPYRQMNAWLASTDKTPAVSVFYDAISGNSSGRRDVYHAALGYLTGSDSAYPSGAERSGFRQNNITDEERWVIGDPENNQHANDKATVLMADERITSFDQVTAGEKLVTHYRRSLRDPRVWVMFSDGRNGHKPHEYSPYTIYLRNEPTVTEVNEAAARIGSFEERIAAPYQKLIDAIAGGSITEELNTQIHEATTLATERGTRYAGMYERDDLRFYQTPKGKADIKRQFPDQHMERILLSDVGDNPCSTRLAIGEQPVVVSTGIPMGGYGPDTLSGRHYSIRRLEDGRIEVTNMDARRKIDGIVARAPFGLSKRIMPGDSAAAERLAKSQKGLEQRLASKQFTPGNVPLELISADGISHLPHFETPSKYGFSDHRGVTMQLLPDGSLAIQVVRPSDGFGSSVAVYRPKQSATSMKPEMAAPAPAPEAMLAVRSLFRHGWARRFWNFLKNRYTGNY